MKQPRELIGIFLALIGTIFTIAACVVALLSWLSPFSPVGSSPISNGSPQQGSISTPIIIVITATSQIQQPNIPTSTQSSFASGLDCTFINDLLAQQAVSIIQWVPSDTQREGAQIQTYIEFDVPQGWIVHEYGKENYAPYHVRKGIELTLWSPNDCRPLMP